MQDLHGYLQLLDPSIERIFFIVCTTIYLLQRDEKCVLLLVIVILLLLLFLLDGRDVLSVTRCKWSLE